MRKATQKEIREYVINDLDAERVVIKKNGEVHARGKMPNTNTVGWYLVGPSEYLEIEVGKYLDMIEQPHA